MNGVQPAPDNQIAPDTLTSGIRPVALAGAMVTGIGLWAALLLGVHLFIRLLGG